MVGRLGAAVCAATACLASVDAMVVDGVMFQTHHSRLSHPVRMLEQQDTEALPRWRTLLGGLFKPPLVPQSTVDDVTRLKFPRKTMKTPKATTGTSYLPTETFERAKAGTKFEKIKLAKDTTSMFTDLYDYAAKIRAGELDWKDVEDADINTRLK